MESTLKLRSLLLEQRLEINSSESITTILIDSKLTGNSISETIAHEFGHAFFNVTSPFESIKWNLIGNPYNPNGAGHERLNPSGKLADKFQEDMKRFLRH
jgi:hypothetical protein